MLFHVLSTLMKFSLLPFALALSIFGQAKIKTGPEAGQTVPAFESVDQLGRKQTLASLTGPKGLMLVFFRSADW